MRRKAQLALAFCVLVLLAGVVLAFASQFYVFKTDTIPPESGATYSITAQSRNPVPPNSSITRHFSRGERLGVVITPWTINVSAVPSDDIVLEFSIFAPSGNETKFEVYLTAQSGQYNNPTLYIKGVEVPEYGDLRYENLSVYSTLKTSYVGEVLSDGNYTLVFNSSFTYVPGLPPPLNYMELLKATLYREYPYWILLPTGLVLFVFGLASGSLTIFRSRRGGRRSRA